MGDISQFAWGSDDCSISTDGDECIVDAVQIPRTIVDNSYFHGQKKLEDFLCARNTGDSGIDFAGLLDCSC